MKDLLLLESFSKSESLFYKLDNFIIKFLTRSPPYVLNTQYVFLILSLNLNEWVLLFQTWVSFFKKDFEHSNIFFFYILWSRDKYPIKFWLSCNLLTIHYYLWTLSIYLKCFNQNFSIKLLVLRPYKLLNNDYLNSFISINPSRDKFKCLKLKYIIEIHFLVYSGSIIYIPSLLDAFIKNLDNQQWLPKYYKTSFYISHAHLWSLIIIVILFLLIINYM